MNVQATTILQIRKFLRDFLKSEYSSWVSKYSLEAYGPNIIYMDSDNVDRFAKTGKIPRV